MIVKNDYVYISFIEYNNFIKNTLGEECRVNFDFLWSRNRIVVKKSSLLWKVDTSRGCYKAFNMWDLPNNTSWEFKPITKNGSKTGEVGIRSPHGSFRVMRNGGIKFFKSDTYKMLFFKKSRLHVDELFFHNKASNGLYLKINSVEVLKKNNMVLIDILKLEEESCLSFKRTSNIYYVSNLLRSENEYYGGLNKYKLISIEKHVNRSVVVFKKG